MPRSCRLSAPAPECEHVSAVTIFHFARLSLFGPRIASIHSYVSPFRNRRPCLHQDLNSQQVRNILASPSSASPRGHRKAPLRTMSTSCSVRSPIAGARRTSIASLATARAGTHTDHVTESVLPLLRARSVRASQPQKEQGLAPAKRPRKHLAHPRFGLASRQSPPSLHPRPSRPLPRRCRCPSPAARIRGCRRPPPSCAV